MPCLLFGVERVRLAMPSCDIAVRREVYEPALEKRAWKRELLEWDFLGEALAEDEGRCGWPGCRPPHKG